MRLSNKLFFELIFFQTNCMVKCTLQYGLVWENAKKTSACCVASQRGAIIMTENSVGRIFFSPKSGKSQVLWYQFEFCSVYFVPGIIKL